MQRRKRRDIPPPGCIIRAEISTILNIGLIIPCPAVKGPLLIGMKMPLRYVVEMFMDRIAACKVYQKEDYTDASPWLYHQKSKRVQAVMHPGKPCFAQSLTANAGR